MNPVAKSRTYKMMLVALFAALIAVGAAIAVVAVTVAVATGAWNFILGPG